MAKNTTVVELFGIPACGKTTLASAICSISDSKIVDSNQALRDFKKLNLVKKLLCHDPIALIRVLFFVFQFPFDERHIRLGLTNVYRQIVLNNYYSRFSDYDCVVIDHGFVQSLVSWMWGKDVPYKQWFISSVKQLLPYFDNEIKVFCQVPISVAIQRIIDRGRFKGRFDTMAKCNPEGLKKLYADEHGRFMFLVGVISEYSLVESLQMDYDESLLVDELQKIIKKKCKCQ